jgi:hypothetical protein
MSPANDKLPLRCVRVNAERFERSHGKAPRGDGYWIFEDRAGHQFWEQSALYSVARRAAVAEAASRGIWTVYVCP